MTDLQQSLAANLKEHRARWGWSQADLAEHSDLSVSYVGDLETGRKWPAAPILVRLADALQVKPFQLLMTTEDGRDLVAWLERRDLVIELGDRVLEYLKSKGAGL